MTARTAAIIGGGVAGVSLGTYLQMSGFDTTVYELGTMTGGVSVGWKRKGYLFDGATNWLPGSGPRLNLHQVIREVLDFDSLDIIEFPEFSRIEHPSGETFTVYKNADRLYEEMMRIAPEDRAHISRFTRALRSVARISLPIDKAQELYSPLDYLAFPFRHWRLIAFILRWRGMTIEEFARGFTNTVLRDMFLEIFPRHPFFSMMALAMPMGWMCMRVTGYPVGGSNRLARALEDRYRSLGGSVEFRAEVRRIVVEDGRATGIELADGRRVTADVVVSAADGHETLFGMLGGNHVTPRIRQRYEDSPVLYPPMLQVSLGLARTFAEPNKVVLWFPKPLTMGADNGIATMLVRICSFDPAFAPEGKTSVVVNLRCHDAEYWTALRRDDREAYAREKQRVAEEVIDVLESRFGGVKDSLEVTDVATPATYERYTHIWRGSYQGFAPTPALVGTSFEKKLPGLRNFYMVGQWVEPAGGLPRAMFSARNVAQIICRDTGRTFRPEPAAEQILS